MQCNSKAYDFKFMKHWYMSCTHRILMMIKTITFLKFGHLVLYDTYICFGFKNEMVKIAALAIVPITATRQIAMSVNIDNFFSYCRQEEQLGMHA